MVAIFTSVVRVTTLEEFFVFAKDTVMRQCPTLAEVQISGVG